MGWVSEQALALFTALAASGAVAYVALAVVLLVRQSMDGEQRALLLRLLGLPIALCWAGLFAAATHLGTPANALYAFTGVGRSPLSNEISALVIFLFLAGVLWLYSFKRDYAWSLCMACLGCSSVAALSLLWFMGAAYDIATVPTWQSPLALLNLILGAVCAGLSIAAVILHMSQGRPSAIQAAFLIGSLGALAASVASNIAYTDFVSNIGNAIVEPGDLGGNYLGTIVLHVILACIGLALQVIARRVTNRAAWILLDIAGAVVVCVSVVLVRSLFYAAYLSVAF